MTPSPDTPQRSPGKHWLRRTLLSIAALVALVAAFYAEEDWRGRRAWNQYRQAIEARGESLDLRTYIPKPVPDDQNFLATPFLKSLFPTNGDQSPINILPDDLWSRAFVSVTETSGQRDRSHRHFTDLVAWQRASAALQDGSFKPGQSFETTNTSLEARAAAAPAVLQGMEPDAAVFAELRTASSRHYSVCPGPYDLEDPTRALMRYLAATRHLCQVLNLQACAELAAGQSDKALSDVKLMLCLADSVKSEPFLYSFWYRSSCYEIMTQPIWEGLAEHRWTDAQLQELQARFLACDFVGDLEHTLKSQRASGSLKCDRIKKQGLGQVALMLSINSASQEPLPQRPFQWIGWFMPDGWYDLEKVNYCTQFDEQFRGWVDFSVKTISHRHVTPEHRDDYGPLRGSLLELALHHRFMASTLTRPEDWAFSASTCQTCANQIALACALERCRLANGQYPEKLDALTPQFIAHPPNDVITGQPYKYRLAANGQFVLYSVGWNEKDDGGVPGKELFDKTQGDWVWEYPAE